MKKFYTWKSHLKNLMKEKQITQQKLSADTGISVANLSRLANDNFSRLDKNTVLTLIEYFDLKSLNELVDVTIYVGEQIN